MNIVFRIGILFFFIIYLQYSHAQPPSGYYDPAEGLTETALQQALHDIIDNHTVIPYSNLFDCFRKTDVRNDSIVWDMYSDRPGGIPPYLYFYGKGNECGNYNSEADCYNREHAFPKSWFNEGTPMISDLFHIYPTDGYVNNRRGNYPFGETKTPSWTSANGSKTGTSSFPGFTGIVFEPVDEYKGDFARTYLYMATRYYGEDAGWTGSEMVSGAQPRQWAKEMLLSWHRKDTVSIKEINRNNAVFAYQKNRNPFIDRPVFAEKIWGTLNSTDEWKQIYRTLDIYPNPVLDVVNVRIPENSSEHPVLIIYNLSGMETYRIKIENELTKIKTELFPPGLFMVKVISSGNIRIGTFLKISQK
jgi:endonuclease I